MHWRRYIMIVTILGALTALAPFSIDTYLPGFPFIAENFNITITKVTLSLSSFFWGMALGQLIYGPLLDRYGRKRPLYGGLLLYIIATAGCYLATSINALIVFRFIQAIGSCAAGVVAVAMVRDLFPVEQNAGIFSLLMLVLGTSPLVAPTIGSVITVSLGWRSIFVVLFMMSVLILGAVYFILPESKGPDKSKKVKAGTIIKNFLAVLKVPQFIIYAAGGNIALSALFAYIASSPAIFMDGYKVSNQTYGWIFALITLGFIGLSQLNRLFSKYYSQQQIVSVALTCMVIFSLIFLYGLLQGWFNMAGTAISIFLILGCIGIINPNATALCMAPFEDKAGMAASLFGALQWGIAGLTSVIISNFKNVTALPLAVVMLVAALLALIIVHSGNKFGKKQISLHKAVYQK
jgi:DHA1 family bicyclomycin/chloramphenicol resistance-like MFS transporter